MLDSAPVSLRVRLNRSRDLNDVWVLKAAQLARLSIALSPVLSGRRVIHLQRDHSIEQPVIRLPHLTECAFTKDPEVLKPHRRSPF